MSASKEKRERKTLYESGALDKNPAQTQTAKKRRKITKTLIILTAVLVLLGSLCWLYFSGFLSNHVTAVTVGEHALSPSLFNYYYWDAYFDFSESNKDYLSSILDPNKPLAQQICNKETKETWADYFIAEGKRIAAQTYALYDAAMDDGFQLSPEEEQSLLDFRSALDSYAAYSGSKNTDAYIRATYGVGCTADAFLDYSRIRRIATSYAADYKASLSYGEQVLRETYAAAPNDFDTVTYKVFYVSKETGKDKDGKVTADLAASEQMARDMAAACKGNLEKFDELTVELATEKKKDRYRDPNFSLRKNSTISDSTKLLQTWLADPARVYGDTTYVQADERAYYVGFYIGRSDNAFKLPTLRCVRVGAVPTETDATGMEKAGQLAAEVLAKYDAGGQTAEAFDAAVKAVAAANSSVLSASEQKDFTPDTLKDVQDDWCFSPERKAGDATMLSGPDGYYVLYFDKFGPVYRDYLVDSKLREADYTAWYEKAAAIYTPESSAFGLLFMQK